MPLKMKSETKLNMKSKDKREKTFKINP